MNSNKLGRLIALGITLILTINLYKIQYNLFLNNTQVETQNEDKESVTNKIEYETVKYDLNLKVIENEQEIWKTYTVDVIETRESVGIYWLDNSKTEGYKIKIKFNENGTVDISEHTPDGIKVRHLAKLLDGYISIKTYDKLDAKEEMTDEN